MRVLLLGSGAREHALARALRRDDAVTHLDVAPGNAGMQAIAECHPECSAIDDPATVVALAKAQRSDLVVIGPEIPLVAGVADALRAEGIAVFGPSKAAAQIEGSKAFAKDVMAAAGVRTARAERLEASATDADIDAALEHFGPHYVVKDDGLAGGKGVVVTDDLAEAKDHARSVLAAGNPVLLESFLDGPEVSLFCFVDGTTVVPLLPAQDHKRAYDGDAGPNTGGMGAYAPLPWLPDNAVGRIVTEVCEPVAAELVKRGTPYSGLLYAGLAWGAEGPAVVEFNCRFGDPETQAVLELLETPLAGVLAAVANGTLSEVAPLRWSDGFAITVVLAAKGYPATPELGGAITGAEQDQVLHAGTKQDGESLVASGGRVLNVVTTGSTLEQAREHAYEALGNIELEGSFFRSDIAQAAIDETITLPGA